MDHIITDNTVSNNTKKNTEKKNIVISSPVGTTPINKPKPNAPCICGSGRKSKKCCLRAYELKKADALSQQRDIKN